MRPSSWGWTHCRWAVALALVPLALFLVLPHALAADSEPRVIAVYGDSLGDGVWSGLYGLLKSRSDVTLLRRSKVGAGLSRADYATWFTELKAQLETDHVDLAVVMVGANDQGSIRDENRKGYYFQTDGWKAVYRARVDGLLQAFREKNIRVVWLGLPIMRKDELNAGSDTLNQIFADAVPKASGRFVPLIDDFKDSDGHFATHLLDAAKRSRHVRAEDGIHFTGYGYELIAAKVTAMMAVSTGASPAGAAAAPISALPPAIVRPVANPITVGDAASAVVR